MTTLAPPTAPTAASRPPGRAAWLAPVLVAWALAYGAVRTTWALTGAPDFPPFGVDLYGIAGWPSAVLCALVLAAALTPHRAPRPLRWTAVAVLAGAGAVLCLTAALLLLDVIGLVFFAGGLDGAPWAGASRAVAAGGGILCLVLASRRRRALHVEAGGCASCGRTHAAPGRPVVKGCRGEVAYVAPAWQRAVSWLVPLAFATRFVAQAVVGFGATPAPYQSTSGTVLLGGMALAGVLLPLALAHTWGQVWPFWVPVLAGRRVPRRLVLGPALAIGVGMTGYFGLIGMTQLVTITARGGSLDGGVLPDAFYWVAVPSYVVWGLGVLALAVGYARLTRRACPAVLH